MKHNVIFILVFLICIGCGNKSNNNEPELKDTIVVTPVPESYPGPSIDMLFMGHEITCLSSELPQQFARISELDENLSYDSITQNIDFYGTTFRLNCFERGFMLMTSVQPDTKQIRKVRDAISKFHGEENFEEDCHYSWLPFTDSTKIGLNYPVIHLRSVRSEEGGTVIIVN